VELFGYLRFGARVRINIDITEFLAAFPAPGSATARAYHEQIGIGLESAGEYIVTGGVLQTPAFAPGTLFGIGHLCYYGMTLKMFVSYFDLCCSGIRPTLQERLSQEIRSELNRLFATLEYEPISEILN